MVADFCIQDGTPLIFSDVEWQVEAVLYTDHAHRAESTWEFTGEGLAALLFSGIIFACYGLHVRDVLKAKI